MRHLLLISGVVFLAILTFGCGGGSGGVLAPEDRVKAALRQAIVVLQSDVEQLVEDGILSEEDKEQLNSILDAAINGVDRDDMNQTRGKLNVFISKIENLMKHGTLDEESGKGLIAQALEIIDLL